MARIHYDILQIQPDASAEEIQHAYRRLALRYHPDHNPGGAAASQMAAINEAFKALHDPSQQRVLRDALTSTILDAARTVIRRNGWTESSTGNVALFEKGNPLVRIVLTDHLSSESLLQIERQHRGIAAILAVRIAGPISVGSRITVIDLMHAERQGAAIPEGVCKSLLSGFL